MPGVARAGTGTSPSAGSRGRGGQVGPASAQDGGTCLLCSGGGTGVQNSPLVTVLFEKTSKDVDSLEAVCLSHPLAVGRHVEF